jgi:hypothetical protein
LRFSNIHRSSRFLRKSVRIIFEKENWSNGETPKMVSIAITGCAKVARAGVLDRFLQSGLPRGSRCYFRGSTLPIESKKPTLAPSMRQSSAHAHGRLSLTEFSELTVF